MKKLVRVIVFISLVLCSKAATAEEVSYEKISCELDGSVVFLTVPMFKSWDIPKMEEEGEKICNEMVAVKITKATPFALNCNADCEEPEEE